jgi:hypothetical protein
MLRRFKVIEHHSEGLTPTLQVYHSEGFALNQLWYDNGQVGEVHLSCP